MTGVPSYSTVPAENVNANTGITWDEGMAPALVNNSARQNMTDMRLQWNDAPWFQYGTGSKTTVIPVYVAATQFKITGIDVTAYWHVGRRVRAVGSGTGTIYGRISVTTFSTDTTVTVVWDSGSLSNEALTISAALPATGSPLPQPATTSFSPTLTFGGGATGMVLVTTGSFYALVNGFVMGNIHFVLTTRGSSTGNVSIGGLPKTSTANSATAVSLLANGMSITLTQPIQAEVNSGATTITPYSWASGSVTQLTHAEFANAAVFDIAFCYPYL